MESADRRRSSDRCRPDGQSLPGSKRRLRILALTSTLPRWPRDTEPAFVLDLCRHLAGRADIRVIAPHAPGARRDECLDGVPVRRFRYFLPASRQALAYEGGIVAKLRAAPWRFLQLPFFLVAQYRAVRRQIRDFRPDVIHAHWILPQGLIAVLAAAGRIPVVCTSHGGDLHGLRGRLSRRIKSLILQRCAAVTVVSDSMVPLVRQLHAEGRISVLPMGTDLRSGFVPPPPPDRREAARLLFVGRLVEKKGLQYLIEALSLLRAERPELGLTVIGDGPLRERHQQQVRRLGLARYVNFLGSIPHAELPSWYQRATLAVFPFVIAADGDQEGFGLVVIEAMGCGCPVIASDLPALRQSVAHGVTGMLVPPADPVALAECIRRCLADDGLRAALAAAALKNAGRFDWQVVARRYHELFTAVAAGQTAVSA